MSKIILCALGGMALLMAVAALALFVMENIAKARDTTRYPPPGQMVDVGGGRRVHIFCKGQGAPTIVIDGGKSTASPMFYPVLDRLSPTSRACAYDRGNMGFSDPAPLGRDLAALAAELDALLTKSGEPGPYVLVGESFGGIIVQTYARAYPKKLAGLVLLDSAEATYLADVWPQFSKLAARSKPLGIAARFGIVRMLAGQSLAATKNYTAEEIRLIGALMSRPRVWADSTDLTAYEQEIEAVKAGAPRADFGALPLLVIRHGQPFAAPQAFLEQGWTEAQARLAALSTDSRTVLAQQNGHTIAEENPEFVANAIKDFVNHIIDSSSSERRATDAHCDTVLAPRPANGERPYCPAPSNTSSPSATDACSVRGQ